MKRFTAELKTFYSKQLVERLGYPMAVLSGQRRMRFGFPFNLLYRTWAIPHDKRPRLPQSIQYPPGMKPMQTGGLVCSAHPNGCPDDSLWIYNRNM